MKKYDIRLLTGFFWVVLTGIWVGCTEDRPYEDVVKRQNVSLELCLTTPGLMFSNTRSMSAAQESEIDDTKIQVLIFEKNGTSELFRYQAEITKKNLPQITLKVPISEASKQYRLVVLANVDAQTIAEGIAKEEALRNFTFDCLGKWNASDTNPTKIPMWGELSETITLTGDRSLNILLHRALARVDVGLLFKFNNPDPVSGEEYAQKETDKESVYGLDHFKIKEIRVYRTKSEAYTASSKEKMSGGEVTAPAIPTTAKYNTGTTVPVQNLSEADSDPLVYTLPAANDSYIREIYIPESYNIDSQSSMDNVPCLVIGGYYGKNNVSEVTYYRADFATYNNGKVVSYLPILRNHQYVFDIKTVNGPGFEEPEHALRSLGAPMTLNIVEWNQVPLGFYVQGHYYFSIAEKSASLEARIQGDLTENSYTVPCRTNLDLDGSLGKEISYKWTSSGTSSSANFDVSIDYGNKTLKFMAKSDNVNTEDERTDEITLTVENFEFKILVKQKAFSINYDLLCDAVKVYGKYREGVSLNYSNYIEVKVRSQVGVLQGAYEIRTLEKNGIYFSASGDFSAVDDKIPINDGGIVKFEYTLKLEGHGTPVNESEDDVLESFNVIIIKNTVSEEYCSARIIMGYKTKRILTIGANAAYRYGYMLEPNTASRAFVDASVNFGVDPNSTVTIEENQYGNAFTIEVMTAGQGMNGEVINYSYLRNKLNTFKPDIILTGQAVNYYALGGNAIQLLADFVDQGGVLLMCNEFYPNMGSVNDMVKKIMGSSIAGANHSIGYDQVFQLASGAEYEDDLILNGPFGDMRGKTWGADGHEMHGFSGLPVGTITYSQRNDVNVCMFRHATKPFFFMGEGGFLSNSQRFIGEAYQGSYVYFPFAVDKQYKPIPRINYTLQQDKIVYNSQIFGNILTWAIDWSEKNGIAYPNTGDKFP